MSSSLDKLPKDLELPGKLKKNYCQALKCLWAKGATQDFDQTPRAREDIAATLAQSASLQENGYDPLLPMQFQSFEKVGKSLSSWKVKLENHKKILAALQKDCANFDESCELDCLESQEKNYLKNGNLLDGSGAGSESNGPSRSDR